MFIEEVMTHDVHTCRADDSLAEAARIMWDCDCGCVPVVDAEGRAVAMITDRDVCMAAYTRGLPLSAMRVGSAASRGVITAHAQQDAETVAVLMRKHRVRRLPVVDAMGRPVGLVSLSDLARRAHATDGPGGAASVGSIVATLAAVGEPRNAAAVAWADAAE